MNKKTRESETDEERGEPEESTDKTTENSEKGNWAEDQKEKSYYYDDSHGYEIYDPEQDDEDDE